MDVTLSLFNGDCLEVMKDIPDKSIDLIICDLPYGCLTTPKIGGQANIRLPENRCAWDVKIDLDAFWKQVKRIRKSEHSPCIHFATTKFGYDLIKSNENEFRYDLVWDKGRGVSFLSANKMPLRSHEMIYVFSKAGANYYRKDIEGDFPKSIRKNSGRTITGQILENKLQDNTGKRCVLSVISPVNAYGERSKGQHPTQKPCDLYRFLIERYCPVGGVVLDPTFGSGNSVFTAYEMDRSAIGIEKDKGFYDKAVERMDAL